MKSLSILVFASVFFLADAGKIEFHFSRIDEFYTCTVNDLSTMEITKVRGRHEIGKTNLDVLVAKFYSFIVHFIPSGIYEQFPNLDSLEFSSDKLEEVIEDDLKPFGIKLKKLTIVAGALEVISSNIFASTPNIEDLNFSAPHLKSIENGAFKKLPNLKSLTVNFPCKNGSASNPDEVKKLIDDDLRLCYDKKIPFTPKNRNVTKIDEPEKLVASYSYLKFVLYGSIQITVLAACILVYFYKKKGNNQAQVNLVEVTVINNDIDAHLYNDTEAVADGLAETNNSLITKNYYSLFHITIPITFIQAARCSRERD